MIDFLQLFESVTGSLKNFSFSVKDLTVDVEVDNRDATRALCYLMVDGEQIGLAQFSHRFNANEYCGRERIESWWERRADISPEFQNRGVYSTFLKELSSQNNVHLLADVELSPQNKSVWQKIANVWPEDSEHNTYERYPRDC